VSAQKPAEKEGPMSFTESLGYVAAFLVLLTFSMKTMVPLRIVGIVSNIFFIGYGYLAEAQPVVVLHCILLPLNMLRLYQILRLLRKVDEAIRGDLDLDWLKSITKRRAVETGEILFRKGETAASMMFVVTGMFRVDEVGIESGPRKIIGELGLLAPNKARTRTVECTTAGEVLEITYDQVKQFTSRARSLDFISRSLRASDCFMTSSGWEKRSRAIAWRRCVRLSLVKFG
jgi:CRP/FNR family cyclic AMP-dependent transcriptional regulator